MPSPPPPPARRLLPPSNPGTWRKAGSLSAGTPVAGDTCQPLGKLSGILTSSTAVAFSSGLWGGIRGGPPLMERSPAPSRELGRELCGLPGRGLEFRGSGVGRLPAQRVPPAKAAHDVRSRQWHGGRPHHPGTARPRTMRTRRPGEMTLGRAVAYGSAPPLLQLQPRRLAAPATTAYPARLAAACSRPRPARSRPGLGPEPLSCARLNPCGSSTLASCSLASRLQRP